MQRVTVAASGIDLGGGKIGYQDANLAAGVQGTELIAACRNANQEEICAVIEQGAAMTLDPTNNAQMLAALITMFTQPFQVITESGDVVVPAWSKHVEAVVIGGGAGGGNCAAANNSGTYTDVSGSGGGAGGAAWGVYSVTSSSTLPVTIGLGGPAQTAGGTSSLGTLLSATGGSPGLFQSSQTSAGGAPGVGVGGNLLNWSGGWGLDGQAGNVILSGLGGVGPWFGAGAGRPRNGPGYSPPINGGGPGAGGSAVYDATFSGVNYAGSPGEAGVVLLRFLP